ncbi:hypothetical protein MNEG_8063 [Monoraphidium neglectum]|uniref:Uncharacterized protein n=1 Tax=Monoraphidium neglectum TaxID=145388 RepID=A0A0D2MGQ6_9CHLO|nr:hypothetical protein MNEG_8063 [Monoraphidium neglectum]KIY99896.1 hypothetical protein MNEG_8063 [Monoraphidium neglectum]|eukprot:XP_013898916.1 hypothetical protein MNEG_8063 [Monoraphidium neglectum]
MRTAPVACPAAARRSSIGAAAARATLQQQHNTQQHLRTGGDNTEPRPDATTSASGRRAALLGLGAAAAALLAAPGASRAAGDAPQAGALEEYVAQEAKGKLKDRRQLDEFRARYNIRRGLDGRVQLRSRKGEWFAVRLDMEVPGALLLRDGKGNIYAIETEGLPQVDLSDDYVLLMLFSDGSWEDNMQPIEYEDSDTGKVVQLNMAETEFREFIGILKEDEEERPADKKKGKK